MKARLGNVKQVNTLIKRGFIKVNNKVVYKSLLVSNRDEIYYLDQRIEWPFVYYMLNKPKGYLSASYDVNEHYVLELFKRDDCFCLGRLDRDTTGLLIVTNDASLKSLLLPMNHVDKGYEVKVDRKIDNRIIDEFSEGVIIDGNVRCLSASLSIVSDDVCRVVICEGKYHQIKKMFMSCGYVVKELKRISFGPLILDEYLNEGDYRLLDNHEMSMLLGEI